jgi:hypothetical protein
MNEDGSVPKPLVITWLMGGLGNQMFQYAAARALALRLGGEVALEFTWFGMEGYTTRSYGLGIFDLPVRKVTEDERRAVNWAPGSRVNRLWRKLRGRFRSSAVSWVDEPHFHYWEGFEHLSGSVCLHGYWQSERYFGTVQQIIRTDFTFPSLPHDSSTAMGCRIRSEQNSVAIHVRRGDYVADRRTNHFHGICSPAYYRLALAEVARRCPAPYLFLFSDEPAWVREHFDTHGLPSTVVDLHGDADDHHDMHLMSLCRHHIIANSSFSWWGAWLAASEGLIYAPARWFNKKSIDTSDLCPPAWQRVDG